MFQTAVVVVRRGTTPTPCRRRGWGAERRQYREPQRLLGASPLQPAGQHGRDTFVGRLQAKVYGRPAANTPSTAQHEQRWHHLHLPRLARIACTVRRSLAAFIGTLFNGVVEGHHATVIVPASANIGDDTLRRDLLLMLTRKHVTFTDTQNLKCCC